MKERIPRLWAWLLLVPWSLAILLAGLVVALGWIRGSDVGETNAAVASLGQEERESPGAAAEIETSLSLVFIGNTRLWHNLKKRKGSTPNLLDHSGLRLHFGELLCQSDFSILSLETPLTKPPRKKKKAIDRQNWSDAASAVLLLEDLGVKSVALANDHVTDFGPDGLASTIRALDRAGIHHVGAGLDSHSASHPLLVDRNIGSREFKMAILAASSHKPRSRKKRHIPPPDRPQVRRLELDEMSEQIATIKSAEPDRFVTIFFHWGPDQSLRNDSQQRSARRLIDEGADLVLGHGSHVPQQVELYRGRWIAYGLGDFAFWAADESPRRKGGLPFGLIARLQVVSDDGELKHTLKLYPIHPADWISDSGGRPAEVKKVGHLLWWFLWRGYKDNRLLKRHLRVRRDRFGQYFEMMLGGAAPLPGKKT